LQILTFSLVPVVLAEIHGFKWVIGCFWLVFAGLDRSSSIVRSTALGVAWSLYGRIHSSIHKIRNWLYQGDQSLNLEVFTVDLMVSSRLPLHLLNSVTPFLHNLDQWDWCFFFTSTDQCRNMWNSVKHL